MPPPSLIQRLIQSADSMPRSQRRVLEVLLQQPVGDSTWRIKELAQQAGVSMPTVLRLARAMGYAGVREFILDLARDRARGADVHRHVDLSDPPDAIVDKVLRGAVASIQSLHQQMDADLLNDVAQRIAHADRIDCFAVGSTSSFMAHDLQARLFRMGKSASAIQDAHQQLIAAASQSARGLVVAISHIGRMPYLLDAVDLARQRGCHVVALTQPGTPLALRSDCALNIQVPPDAVTRVGTEAYIAHLLVIEVLMVLALRHAGAEAVAHLHNFRDVLRAHGQDTEGRHALEWTLSKAESAPLVDDQKR